MPEFRETLETCVEFPERHEFQRIGGYGLPKKMRLLAVIGKYFPRELITDSEGLGGTGAVTNSVRGHEIIERC